LNYGWLAGLVDGDGCCVIRYNGPKKQLQGLLDVAVGKSSKQKQILYDLKEETGLGSAYGNHWTVHRPEELQVILLRIMPYLRLKRKQAELLMEFALIRTTHKYQPYLKREFELRAELQHLNIRSHNYQK